MPIFKDAQSALPFVVEQGRNIESGIYQKKYPAFNYGVLVPVITEGAEWAVGTTFYTMDTSGQAKFISGAANDLPLAGVTRDQQSHDFAMIGAGWEWNMEEVNTAALYGVPLVSAKAFTASESVERLLYDIAISGATEKGWTGLINDPVVARTDAAGTGTGSSTFWTAKDAEAIADDVNTLLGSVRENTLEIHWADTIAIPPAAFRSISTRRLGAGDGMITILEYLRKNNIYTAETQQPLNIVSIRELATASEDGGGRLMAYRRDPDVVRYHLPMPKTVLEPIRKTLMSFEDGVIARTGGVEWRTPEAAGYLDEILDVPA